MRQALVHTLMELAAADERVMLLTADLGFTVPEPFAQTYPDRFYNVGVAEANMVGLATGLAEAGFIPYLYSIATFASMRPYEQFRDGPILHGFPVRLIGIGGGFEYGNSGITHYALEDVAIMRAQPDVHVIVPADPEQARAALRDTYNLPIPIYYRIGKNDKLTVPGLNGRFRLGEVETIGSGHDVLIVSTGAISAEAVGAAALLREAGISETVAIVSTLSGDADPGLIALLGRFNLIVTVEAHFINGGLGSYIAEIMAENGIGARLVRCGVRSMPSGESGSEAYMNRQHGLVADAIRQQALEALNLAVPGVQKER